MRIRNGLMTMAVIALVACQRSPTEPSAEGRRMEIAGSVEKHEAAPGFTLEVILDGTRLPVGGTTTGASYRYYVGIPLPPDTSRHHTLEMKIVEQPASPSTYHVWGWYVHAFDLAEPRAFGSADLPEQRVALRTGETIRWDFDL